MRRFPIALALLALLVVQSASARAPGQWMRVRSPHFTVEGDVSEPELREVALRFEQFREALGRVLQGAQLVAPTPMTVVVFARDRDFKAVRPLFQGKPIEAAGYFTEGAAGTWIVFSPSAGANPYSTLYHEYGHLLISNELPQLPVWAMEGLAEFFGTFELSTDSRQAVLGAPLPESQIRVLNGSYRLLPWSEVIAARHDSRLYNVSIDRGLLYAQSWALVHYLLIGTQTRAGQFTAFLNRVAAGEPADTAFAKAIPDLPKLELELADYGRQYQFRARIAKFGDQIAPGEGNSAEKLSAAEVEALLGQALLGQQRYTEAKARFDAALKLDPNNGAAHTGIGLSYALQGKSLEALPALRKGVEFGGDSVMSHYSLGLAALRCRSAECEAQQAGYETARRAFQRAVELLPDFPDALSYLGFTEMATGASLGDAEKHLTAAIKLIPGREDYRFNLAQVYMREQRFEQAQALLGPIAASPDGTRRSQARELLGQLAAMKNAAAASRAVASLEAAPPPPGSYDVPNAPGRPATGAGKIIPLYRKTLEGERRTEGVLVSIECPRSGVVLVLRDASGSRRFAIPSFDKIQFIAYRDDLKGSITCGPQAAGLPAYVTYRPPAAGEAPLAAGLEGVVVAVEFLPKEK